MGDFLPQQSPYIAQPNSLGGFLSQPDFGQQFQVTNKVDNPDEVYKQFLGQVLAQAGPLPSQGQPNGYLSYLRNIIPFMDNRIGHNYLGDVTSLYPFNPDALPTLTKGTVVRASNDPKVVEEEAETNPEKILGIPTGRDKMLIANKLDLSDPMSVMSHELMHSYLDQKGYPVNEDAFNSDWEKLKPNNQMLQQIDHWLASSPDYQDEMNKSDITQERYAYLAQALSGGGLKAFPPELQKHYESVFK